jgi:hypothetical protein
VGCCQANEELAVVISVIILPVLGWIAGIGVSRACLSPFVATLVGTLSSGIALVYQGL